MDAAVEIKLILSKEVNGCGLAEKLMMIKGELLTRKHKEVVPATTNPTHVMQLHTEMNQHLERERKRLTGERGMSE